MKCRSGCQLLYDFILTVLQQLLSSFFCLGFKFSIGSCACSVFQLQDIAVFYIGITYFVRQQEEVTIAIVHLQFRLYEIIRSNGKIGFQETLQVSFPFYRVTYGRILPIGTGDGFEEWLPMTVEGEIIYQVFQM